MRRKQDCRPYAGRRRPVWRRAAALLLLAALVAFGVLEAVVLSGGRTQIQGQPEIMVIFGCQVKPDGPSALLRDRLDTALDYLEGHPDLTVVVTGGQGDDEHVSEAQCMYDYLTGHGVDGERIVWRTAPAIPGRTSGIRWSCTSPCLLYTSDAADE